MTRARRAAAFASVTAAMTLVGCGSDGMSTATSVTPRSSTTTAATRSITPATADGAHVEITLEPAVSGNELHLRVELSGRAPQPYGDDTGAPIPDNGEAILGTRVDYGDASAGDGTDGGRVHCVNDAALVPVHMVWEDAGNSRAFTHTFPGPGTYQVKFTARVCGLGEVGRTAVVTIR